MKIIQICYHLSYGDGVSNCMLSVSRALDDLGFENVIAIKNYDRRIKKQNIVVFQNVEEIHITENDIILYHFHSGCDLNKEIEKLHYKKILVYQNVTPPYFFIGIDKDSVNSCLLGQADANRTRGNYLKAIVMSDFNKQDLVRYGWDKNDIYTVSLLNNINKSTQEMSLFDFNWKEDYINILFVGRIAPNKKIEDLISFINYYEKNITSKCRLILVGGNPYRNYFDALKKYTDELKCKSVYFASHITDEELKMYYKKSNVFLCMSEHEGFCMPIIEAMQHRLPVVAFKSSAVKDTVGSAGVLFEKKNNVVIAEIVNHIVRDKEYRDELINRQLVYASKMCIDYYISELVTLIRMVNDIKDYQYNYSEFEIPINCCVLDQRDNEEIIIYGAGHGGETLYKELKNKYNVVSFCDNGEKRVDMTIPVYNHNECVEKYKNAIFIISVQKRPIDIVAQLSRSGINPHNIYIFKMKEMLIE